MEAWSKPVEGQPDPVLVNSDLTSSFYQQSKKARTILSLPGVFSSSGKTTMGEGARRPSTFVGFGVRRAIVSASTTKITYIMAGGRRSGA